MGWTRLISGFIMLGRIRAKRLKKRRAPSHDLWEPIQSRYVGRGKRCIRSGLICRPDDTGWSVDDEVGFDVIALASVRCRRWLRPRSRHLRWNYSLPMGTRSLLPRDGS